LHVAFQSYDQVEKAGETFGYGGSIPLEKALRPEVLLAYEMNGEALPQVHGAPLRVVVPGYVAARSVKWVGTITVQDEPSQNFYQQRDYKVFPPDIHEDNVDWAQGEMLGLMRTDAVICVPPEGAAVSPGDLLVQGYAIGGGDSLITRVELSTDDGATWQDAEIVSEVQRWAWCFWQATVRLSPGDHALRVRVHDDQGSVQATSAAALWNFKGYMNNSQHRVCVKVTAG
jgi:sulfite oxidase